MPTYTPKKKTMQVVLKMSRVHCNSCPYDVTHPTTLEDVVANSVWYKDGACPQCGSHEIEGEEIEKTIETEGCYVAPWQSPGANPEAEG